MSWSYRNKKFLYETIPEYFPTGQLTPTELDLWDKFYILIKGE